MATVRITEELIKGMIYRLATVRRPEAEKMAAARPVQAMVNIYNYIMPEDIIKLIESMPSRLRTGTIRTITVSVPSASINTYLSETDSRNGIDMKLYAMSASAWQSERFGPFSVSNSGISFIHGDTIGPIEDVIKDAYDEVMAYALGCKQYTDDTSRMQKTLRDFMTGQPSLNKAVAAMPSMHAFVPPEYKAKLAEVVERKKRTPSAPKPAFDSAANANIVDPVALTELVITAAGTRV